MNGGTEVDLGVGDEGKMGDGAGLVGEAEGARLVSKSM